MSNLEGLPEPKATSHTEAVESTQKSKTNKDSGSTQKTIQTASKAVTGTIVGKGRPTKFSEAIVEEILRRIMNGQNIVQLASADDMPHRDTIHLWLSKYPDFSDRYARACNIRREYKFYELEYTARNEEDVQRARLINDTLKWQLAKEEPKKYGDKLDVTSDGEKVVPILGVIAAQPKIESGDEPS